MWRIAGRRTSVSIPTEKHQQLPGNILVHNHPQEQNADFTLSDADAQFLIQHGLRQIRAVTPKYRFLMELARPLEDTQRADTAERVAREWLRNARTLHREKQSKLRRKVENGRMTPAEMSRQLTAAWAESQHQAWRKIADRFGLRYKREKR